MGIFDGRTALVTGGASGIGRAAALAFAREGATVIVSDVNEVGGVETQTLIRAGGGTGIFVAAEVSQAAEVEALVAAALSLTQRLDYAFNNAGVGGTLARLHDKTEDEWEQVIGVNLKGVWLCLKYEIPVMLRQGGGAVVNMASVAGLVGFPRGGIYSASKHGVIGLTRSAALENARRGLRINAVCPAFTDTPMVREMFEAAPPMAGSTTAGNPMGRLGTPEEIAEAVVWLCSDKASFINGQALALDGGLTAS
ncbi:MAG: SDR family oxidoreductase [Anaerolineae bacterium]|nr:SDR family oxidoreductase [Anaerolineae bacterium]NUQ04861.1 SDR family oxidoreductase [Anaerolineae bacterium]